MAESTDDGIRILWIDAGFFIVAGIVLALNVRGAAEKFALVVRQMPFTGSTTPRTLRIVGGG
ncbi:hypothetical protein FKN01_29535 [Streptomyces sp. 130]|uniref:hypothetical protein n=1 Tax=Streptomyces sp. 130 TaxID=2591006 RepID=UPI00117C5A95|nr:hypothetical protein [Streptomyces sp. 130]TRV72645.1 hypothetical protein FKN01_29535 [Streptomyces sp. 130]